MSKTRSFLQRKAAERIPAPMLEAAGRAVVRGVDEAVERRWPAALRRADGAEGDTPEARSRSVSKAFTREMVSLGAATGATAAAPGLGTASALSLLAAELSWFAFRASDLIMTIGAVNGHTEATAEERRAWVLAVLAHGERAADEFAVLLADLDHSRVLDGERVGALVAGVMGSDVATVDTLRRINAKLGARVAVRFGSREGLITLGRILPFGIGAVVGGTANWALTRTLSAQARRFFGQYQLSAGPPPPVVELEPGTPAGAPPPRELNR